MTDVSRSWLEDEKLSDNWSRQEKKHRWMEFRKPADRICQREAHLEEEFENATFGTPLEDQPSLKRARGPGKKREAQIRENATSTLP